MRLLPALLLLPLICGSSDEGKVRLGCGFGSGMGITDADEDGYGSTIDCDDGDPEVNPAADEYCDGYDNNCDGTVDEAESLDAETWYWDGDDDGWGTELGETHAACSIPSGYGPAGDCNDQDPRVYPDAPEVCDGLDNDCNGTPDDEPVNGLEGCLDADGDGYGDPDVCTTGCVLPYGFVEDDGDCDDADPAINPGAEEICDHIDNDCNGSVDPQRGDEDGDGWDGCDGDCAPEDPEVHPDAEEICSDGLDNDCDGSAGDCGLEGEIALGGQGLLLPSDTAYDAAGRSLCIAGDLDGDGFADLAVGAPFADGATTDHGAVYLLWGGKELRLESERSLADADLVIRGNHDEDMLGYAVAGAGDVDADGLADLVVGAPFDEWPGYSAGAAYLLYGSELAGLGGEYTLEDVALRLGPSAYQDQLGFAVAGAGDVDGDGNGDLLLGAPQANGFAPSSGAVYLVLGPVRGDIDQADASWTTDSLDDWLGVEVAGVGDVDGDGLDDLAMGAYRRDSYGTDSGVAAVVLGRGDLQGEWSLDDVDALFTASQERAHVGYAIDGAGDVDGDGHRDLLVGARGQDYGQADLGEAHLIPGPIEAGGVLGDSSVALIHGEQGYQYAGHAVAGLGDVDGDGRDDIAVGAPYAGESSNAGRVAVLYGPVVGVVAISEGDAVLDGSGAGRMAGWCISGGGDVDGDGHLDTLVGIPGYELPSVDAGAAWLLWGGEGF